MGYQIRMAAEVERRVAELAAHVSSAWNSSPSLSEPRWMLGKIGFWVAQPGLDAAYQQQLLALTRVRRAAADVATSRKRLELRIGDLERQAEQQEDPGSKASEGGAADQSQMTEDVTGQLANLRRQYAEMQAKEERVTAVSRRLMAEINAFRAGMEATKAAYAAAEEVAGAVWAEMSRACQLWPRSARAKGPGPARFDQGQHLLEHPGPRLSGIGMHSERPELGGAAWPDPSGPLPVVSGG